MCHGIAIINILSWKHYKPQHNRCQKQLWKHSSRNLCARRSACRWLSKWITSHQWRRLIDLYKTSGFIYTSNDWIKGVHHTSIAGFSLDHVLLRKSSLLSFAERRVRRPTERRTELSERARVREKERESERGEVERHRHPYTGLLYWSYADWNCTGAVLFYLNYNAITCEGDCWM